MQRHKKIEQVEKLSNMVDLLWAEVVSLKRTIGVKTEKKDMHAWERLSNIGKKITGKWKAKVPSWQLISEARR